MAAAERLQLEVGQAALGDDPLRMRQQRLAVAVSDDAARQPLEQRAPELLLELADALGQRGLRDGDLLRGRRQASLLHDGEELAQHMRVTER